VALALMNLFTLRALLLIKQWIDNKSASKNGD